ncbi:adhesin [Pseudomonas helleri]|uniref:Adhesin n=2 Tax=Pseudomonas helleri TaxID=1608996 RepID=A0A6L5HU98_9PSED|nr:BapA/Bap/LapF family large adhesin [Pseudomonas helleri]MQU06527.1 adhesin [Pseudomonas helleri]
MTGSDGTTNQLVLEDSNGTLLLGQYSSPYSGFTFTQISSLDDLTLAAAGGSADIPNWVLWGLGLLAVGGAAAALSGGGGGGGHHGGDGDTAAPGAPTGISVSSDGLSVIGKGEAGSKVTVKDAAGNVVGTGTVGADGNFKVPLDSSKTNGEKLDVTLTDPSGNQSPVGSVVAPDTTAPEAPTGLTVSPDGQTISGKGEPGSTVTVKDSAGNVIGSGTVGADGNFDITLGTPQNNGQTLDVTLTDPAGNQSPVGSVVAPDTTAPDVPTSLFLATDGVTFSGKGEPGSHVTVRDAANNVVGSGTVGADGNFLITLTSPQSVGQQLNTTLTDAAQNESLPGKFIVTDTDLGSGGQPLAATDLVVSQNGLSISGKGQANNKITVKDAAGNIIGSGTVDADGNFNLSFDTALISGASVDVTLTDSKGQVSPVSSVVYTDTTAPDAPTNLAVSPDGLTLTGKGEAGSTVIVKNAAGEQVGTAVVGADGSFEVTLDAVQGNGTTLEVTLTDKAGNISTATPVVVGEAVAPEAPTGLVVSADGLSVTGKGEPGSTVTIKDSAGNVIGTGTVGNDGNFDVTLGTAQNNGETLGVTLTSPGGLTSPSINVIAGDTTAPDAPTNLAVSDDGLVLSGKGEPGSTITIKGPTGTVIGTGTVGADGTFSITLDTAQTNGETLGVTLTDKAGNVSQAGSVVADDTTAPDAPTNIAVSADGLTLTGKGEAGSTVIVKNADGEQVGTAVVGADGSFEVTLDAAQGNGTTLEVTLTDKAGNISTATPVVVGEAVAPEAPTGLVVSADGLSVTGKGEPGSTVTIKDSAGNVIGTGTVGDDGNFDITLGTAQTNGETLGVTLTSPGGLTSPSISVIAGDTTAPDAPTNLAVSDDGLVLSGKGEPGSTITIKGPTGTVIGTGTVGADGTFSITLDTAQTNGETLGVTLTDKAGNVSQAGSVVAGDTTAPEAPTGLGVSADGLTLSGKGEVGSTVTVKDAAGNVIGSGPVGADGSFEITLDPAQTNGETLAVTQTDAAGNVSVGGSVVAGDTSAPEAPTGLAVSPDGLTLTGKGEVGSTVIVKDAAGLEIGNGVVDADGNFSIILDKAQTNGETLGVTLTDKAGNVSQAGSVVAGDTTAPDAPTNIAVSADGLTLTGKGEAGSTVIVKNAAGEQVGTAVVGADGSFEVTLDAAQGNGTTLEVTLTDKAGNISTATPVVVGEAVAPEAPTGLVVSADGLTVTGKGEVGSTVIVKDAAGLPIGTGVVGADGSFEITLDKAQTNGETLGVTLTNAGGLTSPSISVIAGDTTAPEAPTNLAVSDDGLALTGKGEAGSTVTIKDPAGKVIGTGTVGEDGSFSITLDSAQTNGETLNVTLTDKAGNISQVGSVVASDTTAPEAPTGLGVSADGLTLSGKGEVGSTVTVKDAAGNVIGSGPVAADGSFEITLAPAQTNGQTLAVIQTDAAGNVSVGGSVVAGDTTAPEVPTGLAVSADGLTLTGKGEVGSTVIVKDAAGLEIGNGVVDADGNFSIILDKAQTNGETLSVTLTDKAGNISQVGSVVAGDTTAPDAPTNIAVSADGLTLTGKGEAGSTVIVKNAAGEQVGTAVVGADGSFEVTLDAAQGNGTTLEVTLTDKAGNISTATPVVVGEAVAPEAPTGLVVSADGLTVTGKGEVGSTVIVKDAAGLPIGTGVVGADGSFEITLDKAQTNGETLGVTLTNAGGLTSPSISVIAGDTTAPEAPTNLAVSDDGLALTGKGEPGSTVTIKDPAGKVIGTGTVGEDGSFSITLDSAQTNGETLNVTLTDKAGNISQVGSVIAGDTTAPEAPTGLGVSADGLTLSGKGEVGSTVTVKDPAGNVIGSGPVGADGSFEITLDPAQTNGETLAVTQTDAAGNVSAGGSVVAGDTTAPAAPTELAVSPDGLTLTGKGEIGSTVIVKDAEGLQIGAGVVGADGSFEIILDAAQTNGETLNVTLTDKAGNISQVGSVVAGDTTAPEAPTDVVLSADGLTLTGKGEVGSTVTVKNAEGAVLGSGPVGADGSFEITLDAAQTNGQTLDVTLTDKAGNVSAATPVIAGDTTAPAAPTGLAVSADGLTLTGKGEINSTVIVKNAAGGQIGVGVVDADGNFSITLDSAQTNGETLNVTLTDAAGNVSQVGSVVAGDTTAPDAPTNIAVSADGLTLTGKGEAGSTVIVKNAAGDPVGTAVVGADGSFEVTLDAAQGNGTVLEVTLTDKAGNVSDPTPVLVGEAVAPEAPTGLVVSADGLTVTGKGEIGSTVTVKGPAGNVIGTGVVDADGNFSVTLDTAQTNGESLGVTLTNAGGLTSPSTNVVAGDTTAPDAPTDLVVSADGLALTGKGEAGSTVTVKDSAGAVIGTGPVAADGSFTIVLDTAQTNGETLNVTLTDKAGNISAVTPVIAGDTTAPDAPTELAVSVDGLTLSGKGEIGSTVTVKDAAGAVIGSGPVGADGSFEITLDTAQTNGEPLNVTLTDKAGNVSQVTPVIAGDTTAPDAPTELAVSVDGLTLSGKGEVGSTVTVKDAAGTVIGSGPVGADGSFEITLDTAQTNGETLNVTLTDKAGNISAVTPVIAGDTTAPDAPTELAVSVDGLTLTGKGEIGSTVTVKDAAGAVIGSGPVGADGSFEITLDTAQTNGETLNVTLTDKAGNVSAITPVVAGDTTAPAAPTDLAVSIDGLTLTGKGEAGSTVTVKAADGTVIGSGPVGADGSFEIVLDSAQKNGETLNVTLTDKAGNVSVAAPVVAGDTTAPDAPTNIAVSADGLTLTGKGEVGSTVTVKDSAGLSVGTGVVGADGSFEVILKDAQGNGAILDVTLTDKAGNISPITPVVVGIAVAPDAPTDLAVSADGLTVTGKGEIGSTVTVKDAAGLPIGTGVVGADGSFEVTLDKAQTNGETLGVTLTNAGGLTSPSINVVAGDTTAPDAPADLVVSADGLVLTGKGEAGSTVTVKDAAGAVIGTGPVAADGSFTITLDTAQKNGETLNVTLTDKSGNVSAVTPVIAGDTTAPDAPTELAVSVDGLTLSGKGEVGSTVTVKDATGAVIGSGPVEADGTFTIALDTAQTNGETLNVTLTDKAGNVSAVTPVIAGDTTAPDAPTDLAVSVDGLTLSGKGEVGSTVTVKDAAGAVIGTGPVAADGSFTITLDTAQKNGETLNVTLTDKAGNISAVTPVIAGDTTAPDGPTELAVSVDGLTLSGKGEVGSTVTVKDATGAVIGSGPVEADGTFTIALDTAQTNGETLNVTLTDKAGNVSAVTPVIAGDTTAPDAPTDLAVSVDGLTLSGKGEVGSTVTIKDAAGVVIGSGPVGADGSFEIALDAAQINGETLNVTLTDKAGNISAVTPVIAGDTTAPDAPTELAVSVDGLTLSGKGEVGSTVTVKDAAGAVIGSGPVGADGSFEITLDTAQANGETLNVTLTDKAGNVSAITPVVAGDTTAPDAPTELKVSIDGLTLTGKGEAGSTVTVKAADGTVIGSGPVGADGSFEIVLDSAQKNGEALNVTLTDKAGNVSVATPVIAGDTTAPDAPTNLAVSGNGLILTGKGEVGSTVIVKDAAGVQVGTGVVGAGGNFEVALDPGQSNGSTLQVTLTDKAGNISIASPVVVGDAVAPDAPTDLSVSVDGLVLDGKGEPGAIVTVKTAAGVVIGSGVVGLDGNFSVALDTAQTNGETLGVTLSSVGGLTSPSVSVVAGDTTAPDAPTELAVSVDGLTLNGKGEPGSTVTVKNAAGAVIGSGPVALDGSFAITLNTAQTNGETLNVTLTDKTGNVSVVTPVIAGDTTAPVAPTELAVSADGLTLSGKGEAGSTVIVKNAAGTQIGTGIVDADGAFTAILDTPQKNGETLNVTLTDKAGNVSASTPVTAGDTTAPAAPTELKVSADGLTLDGKGEVGSTVIVKNALGVQIGTGVVGTDGTFAVTLNTAQKNGETLSVTLTDKAGNVSAVTPVIAGDTTAPDAPTELKVSLDGLELTGKGEAGSVVTVKNAAGVQVGTSIVGPDGSFTAILDTPQKNGETLNVTLTDKAGNVSAVAPVVAGDTTAPGAPTELKVSVDGLTLSGKGEVGSAVTVKDAAGAVIGSGPVGADGSFEITLDAAQTNGETLNVTLTDKAGNVSAVTPVIAGDTTAPAAPTELKVSVDGLELTGKGEAGSVVTVKNAAGVQIGTAIVGLDGSFTAILDTPQKNGETLNVTLTDKAGNVSAVTPVIAGDTTAPAAPTDLKVSVDGLALTGKGEAGSTVIVKNALGVQVGTGTVGADGSFSAVLDTPQKNGELLNVTLTDKSGNVSAVTPVIAGDTTAPAAPTELKVSVDGLALTGKGEAGSIVIVKNAAGVQIGTGIVGADGSFTAVLDTPQKNGETLNVTLTDKSGNVSAVTPVIAGDTTAPAAPTELKVSVDGLALTGKGEAGSTVIVKNALGVQVGTGTVDADGSFSAVLDTPQKNGELLNVTLTDKAGNVSLPTPVVAGDTTAPAAPTDLDVRVDGLALTGKGEVGSTVIVKNAAGVQVGTGIVGLDGLFTVILAPAQNNGESLNVTLTDKAGNVSLAGVVTAGDSTAPAAPTELKVSADGLALTGKGEAGSMVIVKNALGVQVGSGTVDANGVLTATLDTPQKNGEILNVTLTDKAGNVSLPGVVAAGDTTAPAAPTELKVSLDGLALTGKGEAGSTVIVKNAAGVQVGTGIVGLDGSFIAVLAPAQKNGESLNVTLTDKAGNVSVSTAVVAGDTTAPAAPTELKVSVDGLSLTGKGEAGSTVIVKNAAGVQVGAGTVGEDGSFSAVLTSPQKNGELLNVTLTDKAGNVSLAAPVTAGDTTNPDAPTNLAVSLGGLVLTGKGEPGAAVTVKGLGGVTVGTGFVGADGGFAIVLVPAQGNGQTLEVQLKDAAGNESPVGTVIVGGALAPEAPTDLVVSLDGLTLSGKGEAGLSVTIKNAAGAVIGTGTVGVDGNFAVTLDTAQKNGETLGVTLTNSLDLSSPSISVVAGDTTAPAAPTGLAVSLDGLLLTGKGETGSIVTVKNAAGVTIGTGVVGVDGSFSAILDTPQKNGETLNVTLTDKAGNVSVATPVVAGDTTAPAAPTELNVSADGLTLTGKGEAGSTVTVKNAAGVQVGTGTVGADGSLTATLSPAQKNGESLNVTLTDKAGNVSLPTPVVAGDTTAPAAPTELKVSLDGLLLTGKGEAGSTVIVKNAAGQQISTVVVGIDGNFAAVLTPAQKNGETLNVTLTDKAGNVSVVTPVVAGDTTAPAAPTELKVSADGLALTGKGEAGSTVTVKNAAGVAIGTGVVGADGSFSATLNTPQKNGELLNVTLTDKAGNVSLPAPVLAGDTTAPAAPTNLSVSVDGLVLNGKGEPGSTVTVKNAAGVVIGGGLVGLDGSFAAVLTLPQKNGETLSVTQTDVAGNVSVAAPVVAGDTTAPAAPTDLAVSLNGLALTGKGEVGSIVTVKNAAGVQIGTGIVGLDGSFSAVLTSPQKNGETLNVTLTDKAGNVSVATPVIAGDTTAPTAPTELKVSLDGLALTGKGEAGSIVTVKNAAGAQVGTGVVGVDGSFTAVLNPPQKNGENLNVTLTDKAGNVSVAGDVTAGDTTAPAAPTELKVSLDGLLLTGKGEAGSTVIVKNAAGQQISTVVVGIDGNFAAVLLTPQKNGETLNVTLTDKAGNVSLPGTVTAGDTTAPAAPNTLAVSADGLSLTGKGEAGSTVVVKNAAGTQIGTGVVGADGSFTATLSPAQKNGESLNVTLTDKAGNVSLPGTVTAGDTTAPAAPTELKVSLDGLLLTGKGEAGSTVIVKNAAGQQIGTVVVGIDGNFAAVLLTPQKNGESLNVTLTDKAGNVSLPGTVTAGDTTAPAAPNTLAVSADGLSLTGKGEAGSTVVVKNAAGTQVGTGVVAADGSFTATLSPAQKNGESLNVTLTDKAGNVSLPTPVVAGDTTAPAAATDLKVSLDGLLLTGKGEAGSTVIVKNAAGQQISTVVVGIDGNFAAVLLTPQKNGETLNVTLTDKAGNVSVAAPVVAGDTTAPVAPTNLVVSVNGLTLTGKGEAGSTVTVKNAAGVAVGSGTVGADGSFTATLSPAQKNGESLNVTLTDKAGNVSLPTPVLAGDTTAPQAPTELKVSLDGLTLTGKGEVGSIVTVKNAAGVQIGTGLVGANGSFTALLVGPHKNGESLTVTLTDKAGNVSVPAPVLAGDTTPPAIATDLALNADGVTFSGKGEAGSQVTVKDYLGQTIGTGTVNGQGNFTVILNQPRSTGETLNVTLKDAAQNVSLPATYLAIDPGLPGTLTPKAFNDLTTAEMVIKPVTTNTGLKDMTVNALLIVGGIAVGGTFKQTQEFSVSVGSTGTLNLASGQGNLLSLLNGGVKATLEVSDGKGGWLPVQQGSLTGGLLDLLGLLGPNGSGKVEGLAAGNYRFTFELNPSLVSAVTSATAKLSVTEQSLTDFTADAGPAIKGNVITDLGFDGKTDATGTAGPAKVQVMVDGKLVDADIPTGAGTVLQGQYGQLTIFANGNYSYVANGNAANLGKVDSFEYHLVNAAGSSTATLYVRIDSADSNFTWSTTDPSAPGVIVPVANDDVGSVAIQLSPEVGPQVSLQGFGYDLKAVGLSLTGSGTGAGGAIVIEANTKGDIAVTAKFSSGSQGLGGTTLTLEKFINGAWAAVPQQSFSATSHTFKDLGEGTYRVTASTSILLSLGTKVSIEQKFTPTYLDKFVVGTVTPATGNVLSSTLTGPDKLGSVLTVISVLDKGVFVNAGGEGKVVAGAYGTLTLFADGKYTYTPNAGLTASNVGQVDHFTYKLTSPTGNSDTAELYIRLDSPDRGLVWDDANPGAPAKTATSFAALAVEEHVAAVDHVAATEGHATGEHGDHAVVADTDFTHVDNVAGTDGLLWEGGDAAINLASLIGKVSGIDAIDLNHVSAVDLTLSLEDLVSITGPEGDRLVIQGDDNDSVHLTGNWSSGVAQVENGLEYVIYTSEEDKTHQLWVQNGISVV